MSLRDATIDRERRDLVSHQVMDESRLIRFVAGPDGQVEPTRGRAAQQVLQGRPVSHTGGDDALDPLAPPGAVVPGDGGQGGDAARLPPAGRAAAAGPVRPADPPVAGAPRHGATGPGGPPARGCGRGGQRSATPVAASISVIAAAVSRLSSSSVKTPSRIEP